MKVVRWRNDSASGICQNQLLALGLLNMRAPIGCPGNVLNSRQGMDPKYADIEWLQVYTDAYRSVRFGYCDHPNNTPLGGLIHFGDYSQ